jgi:hypothetical protein
MEIRSWAYGVVTTCAGLAGGLAALWPSQGCESKEEAASLPIASTAAALGAINVLTRGYNNERTQATLLETVLTPQNLGADGFGLVFKLQLKAPSGQAEEPLPKTIYAAPLYASSVSGIAGSPNVVYMATVNNFVYAFNADTGDVIARRDFGGGYLPPTNDQIAQVADAGSCGAPDNLGRIGGINGRIGIIGTPVIDAASSTMFFVTHTMEAGVPKYRLRAIDIATLADRPNSPQLLSDVDGNFNNQRAALALANGAVYIPFASYCDRGPTGNTASYRGWLLSYDTTSLARIAAFNVAATADPDPNPQFHGQFGGGIWQSAAAPAIDSAGNVYVTTGNGYWNGSDSFGESLVKLRARDLVRLSYLTTTDWVTLNAWDADFGVSGPSLLPVSPQRVIQGTKMGWAYVLPTSNLGGLSAPDAGTTGFFNAIPSNFTGDPAHNHTGFVLWNGPNGLNAYLRGEDTPVYAYRYNSATGTFTTPAFASVSPTPVAQAGNGGMLSLSSNGSSNGILWNNTPIGARGQTDVLHALHAETLAPLLNSRIDVADDVPSLANWQLPVVANGRVYMTAYKDEVPVFARVGSAAGVYRTDHQTWLLRRRAAGGQQDISFAYGQQGDVPIVGDWDGNGSTTIGVYRPSTHEWLLRNSNGVGWPDIQFAYGQNGDIPVVGDWDGNWTVTIGIYRPSTHEWLLRNSNTAGQPDATFAYGQNGDTPVVGDWDGDGTTTIGLYRPSTAEWLLRNSNNVGWPDVQFVYGAAGQGDSPVVGRWQGEKRPGDARDSIGVYRAPGTPYNNTTSAKWLLRNSLTAGNPNIEFSYGMAGDQPVAGHWYPPPGCPLQVCCPNNSIPSRVCVTDSCPIVCPPPPF